MGPRKSAAAIALAAALTLALAGSRVPVEAAGPRKVPPPTCARYAVPSDLTDKPFRFAGETIPLNRADVRSRLRYQINFLLLDARSVLTSWLKDKGRYGWIFQEIFADAGVPEEFVYFAPILSGFKARTYSRLAGVGWWALRKPCDASDGVPMSEDSWHDDRLDLELSTRCFAVQLKRIREKLPTKSWLMAAAAYVSGMETVSERIEAWDARDFWDLPFPEDAETLVVRWMALAIIDSRPQDFGLEVRYADPLTYDQITGLVLTKDLTVADIAKFTETPARLILELNPKLKVSAGKAPAEVDGKRITHSLAAPKGKGRQLVDRLKEKGYLAVKSRK